MTPIIPLFDPRPEYRRHQAEIQAALSRVLEGGLFIQNQEHDAFEREFAAFCGVRHGIGVASGTDAVRIALQALGVGPGDEVITVANAGVPPVAAIREAAARPVFVDVDPATHNLDAAALEGRLTPATRAVLAIHLHGHPADVDAILERVRPRGIKLLEDCAQAHGALYRGRPVGSLGDAAAFSFYPTKNLGAYGDGGLIATNDDAVAERASLLRQYGWRERYVSHLHGINSRLDEIQAAILGVKLRHLREANEARRLRAQRYTERLRGVVTPSEQSWAYHVYHAYVIEVDDRDEMGQALAARGIGTGVHYPVPVHQQAPYTDSSVERAPLDVTERLARRVLSLPMYPELPLADLDRVADLVTQLAASRAHAPSERPDAAKRATEASRSPSSRTPHMHSAGSKGRKQA